MSSFESQKSELFWRSYSQSKYYFYSNSGCM